MFKIQNKRVFILVGFCLLVFLLSSCFALDGTRYNPEGKTLGEKFYLVGPDSYYNMRSCEFAVENGYYPLGEEDSLLNYPVGGKGARPPFFNMIAVSIGFVGGMDALGWAMLLLPVLYGMLSVFPMYHIGRDIFNEKVGLLSAGLYAVTPVVLSYKGSSLGNFDHDSFLILLLLLIVSFLIKSIQSEGKRAYLFAGLVGVLVGVVVMTWVVSYLYLFILVIFLVVKLLIDVYKNNYDDEIYQKMLLIFIIAFAISVPYLLVIGFVNYILFALASVLGIWVIYTVVGYFEFKGYQVKKVTFSILLFSIIGFLVFLFILYSMDIRMYLFRNLAFTVYGGPYSGQLFSLIAEGRVASLSEMIITMGIGVFWLSFLGLYSAFWKKKFDTAFVFTVVVFFVSLWLSATANRFMSTTVVMMIVFTAYITFDLLEKIKSGKIRFKFVKSQTLSMCLIVFILVPNVGSSIYYQCVDYYGADTEHQWVDASLWIAEQNKGMNDSEKPAVLGWWDYGFFIASMGKHPVVSDNYQSGVEAGANYLTATSEEEILAVMIIRLLEGEKSYSGDIPDSLEYLFSDELIKVVEDPVSNAPSYNQPVRNSSYPVSAFNAMYHDGVSIICNEKSVDDVNALYIDVVRATGNVIGYFVVSERDSVMLLRTICYLADKDMDINTTIGHNLWYDNDFYLKYFKNVYNDGHIKIFKYMDIWW